LPNTGQVKKGDAKMAQAVVRPGRSLSAIAKEIRANWPKVYFGAVPYLRAMAIMDEPGHGFGCDSETDIILYFLSNATTWRGEKAREIKKELKKIAGIK
jgi:hypothetical protein